MRELIAKFQEIAPEYAEVPVVVESFDDAFGYKEALNAAFMSGNTPDIFSLSSSENSIYENYTLPLW